MLFRFDLCLSPSARLIDNVKNFTYFQKSASHLLFLIGSQIDFLKDFTIVYYLRSLLCMNLKSMSHKARTKSKQDFVTSHFQSQFSIKNKKRYLNYCGDIRMSLLLGVAYSWLPTEIGVWSTFSPTYFYPFFKKYMWQLEFAG